MLLQIIIAILLGLLAGTITGLIPGIHINLIAIILLSLSTYLLNIASPLTLAIFIATMAITHTFLDFIPSIFLGAPDEDSFLSILPGHKLLLKGRGYYAIIFTLYGSLTALLIILIFSPIFIYFLPLVYTYLQKIMWIILILVSLYLIISEKEKNKILWAFFIFILAGFLGIATLNLNIKEPLLPLFTGLFGASNLLISIQQKTKIPSQRISSIFKIKLSKKSIFKSSLASIIASPFTAFLPGLGAAQAALIGKESIDSVGGWVGKNPLDQREFLFLLGAINTIVMGLSFITIYSINRTRTGAAVAINQILPELTINNIFLILTTIIISGILSFIIAVNISKLIAKHIHKIQYSKLSIIILSILLIIVLIFSDFTLMGRITSLIVFTTSTALGIFTIQKGIRRMHLMGCLLVPTILFYLL